MEGFALFYWFTSLFPPYTFSTHNSFLGLIFGVLAVPFFIFYALARVFFIPMGIVICGVFWCPDVRLRTKLLTAVFGAAASVAVVFWARVVDHMW